MSEINYVLARSYSEVSESNTKSREYFQAQIQSAMRSEPSKRYDQQYHQRDMISDTIRRNPGVVMVTLLVISTQKPKT